MSLRPCRPEENTEIHATINAASVAYRGVIPPDCWHDPYMTMAALSADIGAGVAFWGVELDGRLIAVMGIQPMRDVTLVRHAYVLPSHQSRGAGSMLLRALTRQTAGLVLVGAWAAASWAIAFYRRHGFEQVERPQAARLLRTYWTVSDRQIETSVVLAKGGIVQEVQA